MLDLRNIIVSLTSQDPYLNTYRGLTRSLGLIAILAVITGCGGGGSSSGSGSGIAKGQFKDSNTEGITYVSGDISGTTGIDGSFSYQPGKPVTFSIGNVELGQALIGRTIITPVDLFQAGDSDNSNVLNIVRSLLWLDEDDDPDNGIKIPQAAQDYLASTTSVAFGDDDFDTEIAPVIERARAETRDPGIVGINNSNRVIPTVEEAQAHLEETLRCSYAGAYRGTFTGDDRGNFGFVVNAQDGLVLGAAYSTQEADYYGIVASQAVSYDQSPTFSSGLAISNEDTATFSGQFTSYDDVSGSWNNANGGFKGTFKGKRIGGSLDALYRFTGSFSSDDNTSFGLFSFDLDTKQTIRASVVYDLLADEFIQLINSNIHSPSGPGPSGEEYKLDVTFANGTRVTDATINLTNGTLSGTWENGDGEDKITGDFQGSGCKLN